MAAKTWADLINTLSFDQMAVQGAEAPQIRMLTPLQPWHTYLYNIPPSGCILPVGTRLPGNLIWWITVEMQLCVTWHTHASLFCPIFWMRPPPTPPRFQTLPRAALAVLKPAYSYSLTLYFQSMIWILFWFFYNVCGFFFVVILISSFLYVWFSFHIFFNLLLNVFSNILICFMYEWILMF